MIHWTELAWTGGTLAALPQTPPDLPDDRRTIAFHEAGHAVFMDFLEIGRGRAASIETDDSGATWGSVSPKNRPPRQAGDPLPPLSTVPDLCGDLDFAFKLAAMYAAGAQAEMLLHEIPLRGPIHFEDDDHQRIEALVVSNGGSMETGLLFVQSRAREVLVARWYDVERMAAQLQTVGQVKTDGFFHLIHAAPSLRQ